MTRHRRCLGLLLLTILTLLVGLAQVASARVVGILFDDSGSMGPRIHLPTFGAQLLISTLDGRNGKDRLFTVRLSQAISVMGSGGGINARDLPPGGVTADNVEQWISQRAPHLPYTEESLVTAAQQQATLHDIATQWPHALVNTPYEPVEIILDRLTSEVQQGEEAVLVVMTDGDFNVPPDLARVQASYNRYKERLAEKQATLRIEFLLIAPNDPATIAAVERQGVRAALLTTFNGSPSAGSYEVTNLTQLTGALKDVIAAAAGTDREYQGRYITASGNQLTIDTPLSITRLVSVATSVQPQPVPQLQSQFPNAVDVRRLESAMRQSDSAAAIHGKQLQGITEQMRFQPALPPGRHTLSYDQPVGDNVFLLFETAARVNLRILQADGREAPLSAGSYVLTRNVTYTLEAWLTDLVNNAPTRVSFGTLRGRADFAANVETPSTSRLMAMNTEVAASHATAPISFSVVGDASVRAQARLEGLVSALSNLLMIRIIDAAVTFSTEIQPTETCATCAQDELQATLGAGGTQRSVATIRITPHAPQAGAAILDLSGMPGPLSVVRPNGTVLHDKDELTISDGVPLELDLRMDQSGSKIPPRMPFTIGVVPQPPLEGVEKVQGIVVPKVPQARLRYTGHTGGGTDTPFRLSGSNLRSNPRSHAFVLDFALEDALTQPTDGEFTVELNSRMLSGSAKVDGYAVHVSLGSSWWCICFLYWLDPHNVATVTWNSASDPQTAEVSAPFEASPTRPEMLWSCGGILGIAMLMLWLLLGLLNFVRARRFPRGSVTEVTEGRHLPRHLDLRHWNFTLIRALVPWRAWLLRPPHERTSVEGLMFEAAPGGAMLLLAHSSLDFMVIRLGQSAKEISETNPRLSSIKIIWNDEIERYAGVRMTIRLLRTLGDQLS